jgi:uncharacterized protein (TIGR03437 family)
MTLFRFLMPASLAGLAVATGLFAPAPCLAQATSYNISTIAGSTSGTAGFSGDGVKASQAELNEPIALAFDSQGNLYIADSGNERIRMIAAPPGNSNSKIQTVAGDGSSVWVGDNLKATGVSLNSPYGVLVDSSGNIYISDTQDDEVRKVTASTGIISDFAGQGIGNYGFCSNPSCSEEGIPATQANVDHPVGLAIDKAGNIYIADSGNDRIRLVNPSGNISTFAGANQYNNPPGTASWSSYGGDGGPATAATLYNPLGLALDAAGNLYIADSDDNCVRKVTAGSGIITTVAGQCATNGAFAGDGGLATKASLNRPWGVVATPAGDLFISDYNNEVIRMVSGITGIITTVAGEPNNGTGYTGDGGLATNAQFNHPTGLALDASGNLYVADADNNVIRMMTPNAPTISNVISASGFGAFTSVAPGSWIEIYGANLATDGRSWQTSDFQGSTAPTNLDGTTVTVGGQPAYIDFISGGQVNALVPSNVGTGQQQVVVKTAAGSASYTVNVNSVEPGLLALPAWNIAGTQYAVSVFPNTATETFVLPPGAISGVTSQRVQPGQTIVLYGIGFGPVSPAINAGQPGADSSLTGSLNISIGGVPVPPSGIQYAGMAPNFYGLYQFNVVVPSGLSANDKTPLTFSLDGSNSTQTLYLAVQ